MRLWRIRTTVSYYKIRCVYLLTIQQDVKLAINLVSYVP